MTKSKPPPPWMQKLNKLLHEEPYASVAYAVYWICVLALGMPTAVIVLSVRLISQLVSYYHCSDHNEGDNDKELAVVVTGCDTGFGKEIALAAALECRYVVFAGCLNTESFEQFKSMPNIIPIKMDVTSDQDVSNVARKVEEWVHNNGHEDNEKPISKQEEPKRQRYLHALINNAGIGIGYNTDLTDLSIYQKGMDVNFFGVVRCCKAFLPILKDQAIKGTHDSSRIFNITSYAGLSNGGPFTGAYSASKHAAQAFSQSLRAELAVFGIQVSTINPTFHGTPLVDGMGDQIKGFVKSLPDEKQIEYGEDYFNTVQEGMTNLVTSITWNADVVTDQMVRLLKMKNNNKIPPEVVIGMDGKFLFALFRILPVWVCDSIGPPPLKPAILLKPQRTNNKHRK